MSINSLIVLIRDMPVKNTLRGFPGGSVVKNLTVNAGNTGSIPGTGGFHMPWSN